MKKLFVIMFLLLTSICFAANKVEKITDTDIKVTTTLEPQNIILKDAIKQLKQWQDDLKTYDDATQKFLVERNARRQIFVNEITRLQDIIQQAKDLGVKDE